MSYIVIHLKNFFKNWFYVFFYILILITFCKKQIWVPHFHTFLHVLLICTELIVWCTVFVFFKLFLFYWKIPQTGLWPVWHWERKGEKHRGCPDKDETPFVSCLAKEMILENQCFFFSFLISPQVITSSSKYVCPGTACVRVGSVTVICMRLRPEKHLHPTWAGGVAEMWW